jgi:mercuric ion binding protein
MSSRAPSFVIALILGATPFMARAADTTVALDVHYAGCVLCGPIVKRTLAGVKGVQSVAVSQSNGMADVTATVAYDPAATKVAALIKALTDRGYPASVKR